MKRILVYFAIGLALWSLGFSIGLLPDGDVTVEDGVRLPELRSPPISFGELLSHNLKVACQTVRWRSGGRLELWLGLQPFHLAHFLFIWWQLLHLFPRFRREPVVRLWSRPCMECLMDLRQRV